MAFAIISVWNLFTVIYQAFTQAIGLKSAPPHFPPAPPLLRYSPHLASHFIPTPLWMNANISTGDDLLFIYKRLHWAWTLDTSPNILNCYWSFASRELAAAVDWNTGAAFSFERNKNSSGYWQKWKRQRRSWESLLWNWYARNWYSWVWFLERNSMVWVQKHVNKPEKGNRKLGNMTQIRFHNSKLGNMMQIW